MHANWHFRPPQVALNAPLGFYRGTGKTGNCVNRKTIPVKKELPTPLMTSRR